MNHPATMGFFQALDYVQDSADGLAHRKRTGLGYPIAEGLAGHQLHDDEQTSFAFTNRTNEHAPRVIDRTGQCTLLFEALNGIWRLGPFRIQELDGHMLIGFIQCLVNLPMPPSPNNWMRR